MPKTIRYKGQQAIKPDNISMKTVKRVIDECGKDYSITVDSILQLISKHFTKISTPK